MQGDDNLIICGETYTIKGRIGEGGAGNVLLARDKRNNFYAIKVIRNYNNPFISEMVNNEIDIQKKFKGSQYVIQFIAEEFQPKIAYIVFELGACSLRNVIDYKNIREREFLSIVCDMCKGLFEIHQKQVIHRDIKPENIILKDQIYKITDFGVSCDKAEDQSSTGTFPYMAPQILFDDTTKFTNKIDIWSMGVTIFQVLFNIHPFLPEKIERNQNDTLEVLKKAIQELTTPKFTIEGFIKFLRKKNMEKQAKAVQKKMKTINKSILSNICLFFERDYKKREQISTLCTIFLSLKESLPPITANKVKANPKNAANTPPQIKMMIKTLNIVYEVQAETPSPHIESIIFSIQLAIWFLTGVTYGSVHYMVPNNLQKLKKHMKPRNQVWDQIRAGITEYYFWLNDSRQELEYFQKLNELKFMLLICAGWRTLIENDNDVRFCRKIHQITKFQIYNPLEVQHFLKMFTDRHFHEMENMMLSEFNQ